SSFGLVHRGLRALLAAGAAPDVRMVITPETAPFLFRSVRWLWDEGFSKVKANLELSSQWGILERATLQEELIAVGREMLARRLRGQTVSFAPLAVGARPSACG